ncbi:MAG: aminodeoxychorismate/anthranilate synthase component II [Oscillospiraceae bacterium]|jgi:anthranilate synthase component 2
MILFIDNYDSFTYNLVQLAGSINPDIRVVRNDVVTVSDVEKMNPSHIIISPGPGYPKDAGISEELVNKLKEKFVILGICLGHQGICEVMGAEIVHAKKLIHGKQTKVLINTSDKIFKGLEKIIPVARYHSLIAKKETLPDSLEILSEDLQGEIMAVKIKGCEVYGLQFHPESILTPNGEIIMNNFLSIERSVNK